MYGRIQWQSMCYWAYCVMSDQFAQQPLCRIFTLALNFKIQNDSSQISWQTDPFIIFFDSFYRLFLCLKDVLPQLRKHFPKIYNSQEYLQTITIKEALNYHCLIYFQIVLSFSSLLASTCLLAKVSATIIGKTKVASEKILTYLASKRSLAQVQPSEALAPESLPSSYSPVFMYTAQSRPFLQIFAFRIWCLGTPPPMTIAPDLAAFMANLEIYLVSSMISITKSFLYELVNKTSPIPPSVMAGQNTGILFLQHQQQMLSSLLISFPNLSISFLGVHFMLSLTCSLYICLKMGSKNVSSLRQLSLVTKMFPILQCPLSLFSISFMLNSPKWKLLIHFMRSSSMPPAVVTMQSIILCWAKYLMISLIPQEVILEVYPRKMVHLVFALYAGSVVSSSSLSLRGSSESLQLIIQLMISIPFFK